MRLSSDLKLVVKRLKRAPGFVLAVVLMLSLGIGLSVAMFSVLNGVVLNALPYPDAEGLVSVDSTNPRQDTPRSQITPAEAVLLSEELAKPDSPLSHFGYYNWGGITVFDGQRPRETSIAVASPGFFPALGMQPMLGRLFNDQEYAAKSDAVVISYREWQRLLGGRPEAIGEIIDSSEGRLRVIGVMPPAFAFPSDEVGAWLARKPFLNTNPSYVHARFVFGIGRLKPELSAAAVAERFALIAGRVRETVQLDDIGWRFATTPTLDDEVGDVRGAVWGALGIALLVLLIACANVAILFDARQVERRFDWALSQALGATSRQVWRSRMLELATLCTLGLLGGLVVAATLMALIKTFAAASLPRVQVLSLDGSALAFAALIGALTPLLALLAGALRQRLVEAQVLRSGGKALLVSGGSQRRLLPVIAIAISTVSLVTAVALALSMSRLSQVDPGFRSESIQAMQMFRYGSAESAYQFADELRERLAALPGSPQVALTSAAPLSTNGSFSVDLKWSDREDVEPFQAALRRVDDQFRAVLAIPLITGRDIASSDTASGEKVAVINRELARRSFGAESPLGKILQLPLGMGDRIAYRVVGVVDDIHNEGLRAPAAPEIWVAFAQAPQSSMTLILRGGASAGLQAQMAEQVWALDPRQAITRQFDLQAEVDAQLQTVRFFALTVSAFAFAAVLLGAIGVYAIASLQQRRRTREFGLRLAVGARPLSLGTNILKDGVPMVLIGAALGLLGGWLTLPLVAEQTFGLDQQLPWITLLGVFAMAVVALAALAIPAWRAARLDPIEALRYE